MEPQQIPQALTLGALNSLIARQLSVPQLNNVWVVAELSDLRANSGHCYMELIEKNANTGAVTARLRGIIWASNYPRINAQFYAATGQRLVNGLKVMLCGMVNYHSAFGISFLISDINAEYTMGEAERRRREIIMRLQREGVIDLNKQLSWPTTPQRIAVISAKGAAGYGDFINQLYNNSSHLRFTTRLFEATMQGERTVPSVIAALDRIAAEAEQWDCVVIIRGGGATSELGAFDDYDLASNVAQFPLPVIIGIGHERDVTVLDYVANMRVKTPTAAAEWLIECGDAALSNLHGIATDLLRAVTDRISGSKEHLAYSSSALTNLPSMAVERAQNRLHQYSTMLMSIGTGRIPAQRAQLQHILESIRTATANRMVREAERLDSKQTMLDMLSPQATLRRGYSITRVNGVAIRSAADIPAGTTIGTTFADGSIESTTI